MKKQKYTSNRIFALNREIQRQNQLDMYSELLKGMAPQVLG